MQSTFVTVSIVIGIVTFAVVVVVCLRLVVERLQRDMRLREERAAAQRHEGFQKFLKSVQFYLEADDDTVEREKGGGPLSSALTTAPRTMNITTPARSGCGSATNHRNNLVDRAPTLFVLLDVARHVGS
jgi:hypothetical protein